MAIFKSISSISNSTTSLNSWISNSNIVGSNNNENSVSCFDGGIGGIGGGLGGWGGLGGFDGGCGSGNFNIINIDIDIGRRHRRRCC
ncbi:hypothetical protein RB653_010414 [Dictyostelium firmibasis]|uniref:Uncharacterized protein n=1 Tax=Dictyostelium firmibasis TaxID=79012 RepID=A0AAN7TTQ3_9MYCE